MAGDGPRGRLRARLRDGERLLGTFVKSRDPLISETLATAGYDFLVADLEHSSLSAGEVEGIVRACDAHDVAGALAAATGLILGHGTPLGIFCATADEARRWASRGLTLLAISTDLGMLRGAAVSALGQVRAPG